MKTSEEVYNRILTDTKFNPCNFAITYYDGIKKKYIDTPLLQWKPTKMGGDIPWTRVYYIKFKGKIVWDRLELKYDIEDCCEEINYLPEQIKVMSFNVLSDIYDRKITNMEKRKTQILDFICIQDCDIICLQEITDEFCQELEKLNKYIITKTDSKTNNIVIMSKINPKLYEIIDLDTRGTKKALKVKFQINEIDYLTIIGIHLTSNTHKNSKSTRIQQISKICNKIPNNESCIILGDTNEPEQIDLLDKFIDSNGSTTPTYNPIDNILSKQLTSNGIKCRYDRIYHYLLSCDKFEVIENNTMSDHYPVIGIYNIGDEINFNEYKTHNIISGANTNTTHKTSLCIIPPWNIVSSLPVYNDRWMPHINLFWGFVPECEFDKYYSLLTEIKIEPFKIRLNQLDILEHENKTTVCLKPDTETIIKLKKIYDVYSDAFGNKIQSQFNPHLSIETIETKLNNADIQNLRLKYNYDFEFIIENVKFISRETTEYMCVKKIVSFKLDTDVRIHVKAIIDFLSNFCEIKICGSRFFIDSSDSTDLDLLGVGQTDRNCFFDKLIKPISQCGLFCKYEIIKNEHVHEMKLYSQLITIDLQYVNQLNKCEKYYIPSWNIYAQPLKAQELINGRCELFKECLIWTKNIFKQFKSYGQMYGYLSGMSILILVVYTIKKFNPVNLEEFIQSLKLIDYDSIITLKKDVNYNAYIKKTKSDELMIIQELVPPYLNTVRTITKSTKQIIVNILKNNTININLPHIITMVFEAHTDEDIYYLEELNNWMSQPIMKLIIKMEKNSSWVIKPFDKWHYSTDKKKLLFKLRHNCETNLLDHELEKISLYSKDLIKSKNISFNVVKNTKI